MIDLRIRTICRWAGGATLALALAACVPISELAPRHTPSGREIALPSADFAAYVRDAKAAIAKANQAIGRPLDAEVIEDRAPFELVPGWARCPRIVDGRHAQAALLIHDLGGTPYEMRDLGRALAEHCYLVRAILLPGHGTVPGDLLEISYREWIDATRSAVAGLAGKAERLVLVGFGLGATLAIQHALSHPSVSGPDLTALVLLAPAVGTDLPFAEQLGAEAGWTRLLGDDDPVRYESLPRNAEIQRARLIAETLAQDALLDTPVFMAISADDAEVDPGAARDWFCRRLSGPRGLIWYTTAETPGAHCQFVSERSSAAPPEILDFSHVALPIAPKNPRYGAKGAFRDCAHYYWEADTPSWFICMDPGKTAANSEVRLGEITEINRQRHLMRRLTYNPDFAAMVSAMLAFLAEPS